MSGRTCTWAAPAAPFIAQALGAQASTRTAITDA